MSELIGECVLNQVLRVKLTNGNDGQSKHWGWTHRTRKDLELFLLGYYGRRKPFQFPVRLRVTRILGKGERQWDKSSLARGSWKQLEDALVSLGWFADDGPKFITDIEWIQDDSQRHAGPAVQIEAFKVADSFETKKSRKVKA
jgi:transglutaminase-like putative cysteine protease